MNFIVLEGRDKVGKTTQSLILYLIFQHLNKTVILTKLPNNILKTGQLIQDVILKKEKMNKQAIHNLFATNRQEIDELYVQNQFSNVNSQTNAISHVDIDKNPDASILFTQMINSNSLQNLSKLNEIFALNHLNHFLISDRWSHSGIAYSVARGLSPKQCYQSEEQVHMPDLIILFKGNGDHCVREEQGTEAWDHQELQGQLDSNYDKFAQVESKNGVNYWAHIDISGKSIIQVTDEVLKILCEYYEQKNEGMHKERPMLKDKVNNQFQADLNDIFSE